MTRDLRLVSASLLLWGLGEGMFMYFLAIYLESLGATPVQIGGILGIAGAALAVTHLPAGALSDVVSRRAMMIFSWALATVAAFLMFAADTLTLFSIGLVIYYMSSFVMAPLSSYIASGRGEWSAARTLTTVYAGYSVGAIVGPLLGGLLAPRLGVRPLFGIAGLIFIFSTLMIFLIRAQPREASEPGQRSSPPGGPGRAGFRTNSSYLRLNIPASAGKPCFSPERGEDPHRWGRSSAGLPGTPPMWRAQAG